MNRNRSLLLAALIALPPAGSCKGLDLLGLSVTPHQQSPNMRYRRAPDPQLGARVELFLRNETQAPLTIGPGFEALFDGRTPSELLAGGDWAWHDTPAARTNEGISLPPGAITVWSFNSRGTNWGSGTAHRLGIAAGDAKPIDLRLDPPRAWISAVTFLGQGDSVQPTRAIVHVNNTSDHPLTLRGCRLWLPTGNSEFRVLRPQPTQTNLTRFPAGGIIPPGATVTSWFPFVTLLI